MDWPVWRFGRKSCKKVFLVAGFLKLRECFAERWRDQGDERKQRMCTMVLGCWAGERIKFVTRGSADEEAGHCRCDLILLAFIGSHL